MKKDAQQDIRRSILVVDDNDSFRERLVRAFKSRGLFPQGASDYHQAMKIAELESPELAVVDLRMPGPSGLELVRDLLELDPSTRVVVLTGYGSIATALTSVRLGAQHYLVKPADADEILAALYKGMSVPEDLGEAHFEPPTLARIEREHIERVLDDCDGNISEASRRLGIHRRSLQRKLQKYPAKK